MRLLALDVGDKRTGLATGDTFSRIVTPLRTVTFPLRHERTKHGKGSAVYVFDAGDLVGALVAAAEEEEASAVIVGHPINMDGTVGPRAELVEAFAGHLHTALVARGVPADVHLVDERLTSAEADWQMAQTGLTHKQKKRRRDALAAAAILRAYLDHL